MNIPHIPFLAAATPESFADFSVPAQMIHEHLNDVAQAIGSMELHRVPEPVYMGHNFDNPYAALTQPVSEYSQDLARHLISTAAQPESLQPTATIREISTEPIVQNILNDEVRPLDDMQIALMNAETSPDVSTTPVVPVVGNVVDLNTYRTNLDIAAIRNSVLHSSIDGDQARADLAKAA